MAVSVTANRMIRVAEGTIWRRWLEVGAWAEWRPEIEACHWLPGSSPWEENSRFAVRRQVPLPLLDDRLFTATVRSVVESQLLVYELTPDRAAWLGPILVESLRLEPAPSGTSVSLSLSAHGLGPTLLGPLVRNRLQGQAEATLEGLQRRLAPAERRL